MTLNTEWKKVAGSVFAAVVFSFICVISYSAIDGMSGGYALAFISFFLAVSSIAVALLFVHRAMVMDRILMDPNPLAHWTYTEEMAQKSAEMEFQDYQERNRAMFIVIGGMLVLVSLFFLFFAGEDGHITAIFLLAFTGFLFIVSRVMPKLERRRAMDAPREAFITRIGIINKGTVYPFRSFLMFLSGVSFRKATKKNPALIIFSFTQLVGRFIIQPFDVVITVPPDEEELAGRIVSEISGVQLTGR